MTKLLAAIAWILLCLDIGLWTNGASLDITVKGQPWHAGAPQCWDTK